MVKLENFFTTLEYQNWDKLCVPCFLRAWGFYNRVGLTFVSWPRRYFLMERNPNKCMYFMGFFPYRGSMTRVNHRAQDISIQGSLEIT